MNKSSTNTSNQVLNIMLGANRQGLSAPDDTDLAIQSSKTGTKYATKKNFCSYCHKLQSKLARHLELAHKNEDDVKKFITLPPRNQEKQQIISVLRKNGNHLYNTDTRFNKGDLLVVRKPQERMKKSAKDFMACGNCRGQYS